MSDPIRIARLLVPLALLGAAGCAGHPQPPVADLSAAGTLVDEAQQSGASQYDSADLAAAQSKLRKADEVSKEQPALAARLASESQVDAQVALARTRAQKAQQSLRDVNGGLDSLRDSQREPGAPPSPTQASPQ